jgi:hypothetical protein
MNLNIHYFLLNEDFSQEHADANHNGQESENNLKYEWEDEIEVKEIDSFEILRKHTFPINAVLPDDTQITCDLSNMFCIKLITKTNEIAYLGVSESILADFEELTINAQKTFKIYLKDMEPHGELMPGVYLASKEFPKELIF